MLRYAWTGQHLVRSSSVHGGPERRDCGDSLCSRPRWCSQINRTGPNHSRLRLPEEQAINEVRGCGPRLAADDLVEHASQDDER